jgi:hypothetical protein
MKIYEDSSTQEVTQVTEGGCDPVNYSNAPRYSIVELNEESNNEWKRNLSREIEQTFEVPPSTKELYNKLKGIWEKFGTNNDEMLFNELDKFVGTFLQRAVIKSNTDDEGDRSHQNKYKEKGKNKYKNKSNFNKNNNKNNSNKKRNRRHRYMYARCQGMFRECPRKLVDVVINNDMAYLAPARQPPETKEVDKLYKDLWGKIGPQNPPIPTTNNCASGGLIHEYFPPIIAEEINERLKRIKNKTAAGPGGLQKKHLLVPGLPIVLALLFNILCLTSHFL